MRKILLLEADKLMASSIKAGLARAGYRIDWQVDPQIAMDSADTQPPRLIIMDLSLASRSGVEFLYEFRSYPEWDNVPIIIYSSVSLAELADSKISLKHLNISSFLYKPDAPIRKLVEEANKCLQTSNQKSSALPA